MFPPPQVGKEPRKQEFDKLGGGTPLLVIYGLVELHKNTSEWSTQGLGNSIAGLVEAGRRTMRRVVLMEERKTQIMEQHVEEEGEELECDMSRKSLTGYCEERLPMLNGSVRRAGFENEESGWSGRTVEVGQILARWFKFGRGDWDC